MKVVTLNKQTVKNHIACINIIIHSANYFSKATQQTIIRILIRNVAIIGIASYRLRSGDRAGRCKRRGILNKLPLNEYGNSKAVF